MNLKISWIFLLIIFVFLLFGCLQPQPKGAYEKCVANSECLSNSCINGFCSASGSKGACNTNFDCQKDLICSSSTCVQPNPFCFAKSGLFWFAVACIVLGALGLGGSVAITHDGFQITVTMGALLFGILLLIINFIYIVPC